MNGQLIGELNIFFANTKLFAASRVASVLTVVRFKKRRGGFSQSTC